MDITVGLGLLLILGFLGGRLARLFKLPAVTGYILAGVVMGPSFTNLISSHLNESMDFIKVLGLGLIALIIGGDLHVKGLKALGKSIFVITLAQVGGAFIAVFLVTRYLLGSSLPISLLLGAMASATAPASPVAVIREYRAKGLLTSTILAVVGLDDAACITLFSIVTAIVAVMVGGAGSVSSHPIPKIAIELGGSAAVGAIIGLVLILALRFVKDRHQRLVLLISVALLGSALAERVGLSAILANMVTGFVVANFGPGRQLFNILEDIELPIFVVFFALAGASLHLGILYANWVIALVYVLARGVGKVGGVFAGAAISGAEEKVKKYLGFAMFSKAGVTIGLVLLVQAQFPQLAPQITAIELAAVAVCELIGPIGTRYALLASGEGKV